MFKKEEWFTNETDSQIKLIHEKVGEFEFSFNKSLKEKDLLKLIPIFQKFYILGKDTGKKQMQSDIKNLLGV